MLFQDGGNLVAQLTATDALVLEDRLEILDRSLWQSVVHEVFNCTLDTTFRDRVLVEEVFGIAFNPTFHDALDVSGDLWFVLEWIVFW